MRTAIWAVVWTAVLLAVGIGVWEFGFDMAGTLGLDAADLRLEMVKVLWQFLLIAVLGGAVALFFKGQEIEVEARKDHEKRERESRANRREALLRMRDQLVEAFHSGKSIRRLLRGLAIEGLAGQESVRKAKYISLMRRLIDAQLRFEYYVEYIDARKDIFGPGDALVDDLEKIARYLNTIVDEFEKARFVFDGNDAAPLAELENLQEFIGEFKKESDFNIQFRKPFVRALKAIEAEVRKE